MVDHRIGTLVALLMLLSPVTAVQLAKLVASNKEVTQATTIEMTLTYGSANMRTYFESSIGTTLAGQPLNLPTRVIGFMTPAGKCSVYSLPVTVTSGTILSMKITANNHVNLYLFSDFPPGGWPTVCKEKGGMLNVDNFTDYTLRWTAPKNGTFYLVFTGPTAIILLTDVGSIKPIEQTATMTVPMGTETKFTLSTLTTAATSTMTISTPLYIQTTSLDGALIVGTVIAILVVALVLLSKRFSEDRSN
jgi:hypothetical protein